MSVFLKAEVARGEEYEGFSSTKEYAHHHIVSNSQLEQLLLDQSLTEASIEEYLNEKHIKGVIIKHKLVDERPKNERGEDEHGQVIHACVNDKHALYKSFSILSIHGCFGCQPV